MLSRSPPRDGFSLLADETVDDIVPKELPSLPELDSDASALMVEELRDGFLDDARSSIRLVEELRAREHREARFSRLDCCEPPSDASRLSCSDASRLSSAARNVFGDSAGRNFHIVVEGKAKSNHISGACRSSRSGTMFISTSGGEPPGMSSWDDILSNPT